MQFLKIIALSAVLAVAAIPQTDHPTISVSELPPEAIPVGTCGQSISGYLGIVGKDKKERTKLTDQEIGEYVQKKLTQGYSVSLYPQASGKIFAVETCHPTRP
jgi:hypothetical protein